MTQLTHKELMLLQDNINMCQETVQFLQGCLNMVNDPQLKNLCQQMIQDHKQDAQTLSKHIIQTGVQ
jgi:rubrerythrin